ncbi:hypothetical protein SpCBS45565_g04206 [Spizellomyces sp. 'palustris']|nr:hypothetical protein SpCBS45565_g04206 [Spizellomyces sp. 'palustris']
MEQETDNDTMEAPIDPASVANDPVLAAIQSAGVAPVRFRSACDACRARKVKCTPIQSNSPPPTTDNRHDAPTGEPCGPCWRNNRECSFGIRQARRPSGPKPLIHLGKKRMGPRARLSADLRAKIKDAETRLRDLQIQRLPGEISAEDKIASLGLSTAPLSPTSPSWSTTPPMALIETLSNRFFNTWYNTIPNIFLHRRTFLATLHQQPDYLLYAVCALSAYRHPTSPASEGEIWTAQMFFKLARKKVHSLVDKPSLAAVQALILLGTFAGCTGKPSLGFRYCTMSTHMAMALSLDSPTASPSTTDPIAAWLERETQARTWFACLHNEVCLKMWTNQDHVSALSDRLQTGKKLAREDVWQEGNPREEDTKEFCMFDATLLLLRGHAENVRFLGLFQGGNDGSAVTDDIVATLTSLSESCIPASPNFDTHLKDYRNWRQSTHERLHKWYTNLPPWIQNILPKSFKGKKDVTYSVDLASRDPPCWHAAVLIIYYLTLLISVDYPEVMAELRTDPVGAPNTGAAYRACQQATDEMGILLESLLNADDTLTHIASGTILPVFLSGLCAVIFLKLSPRAETYLSMQNHLRTLSVHANTYPVATKLHSQLCDMVQSLLDKTVLDTSELHGARGALVDLEGQGQWGPVIGLGILGKEQEGKDSGVDTSGGMADHVHANFLEEFNPGTTDILLFSPTESYQNDSHTPSYMSSHGSSHDSSKSPPSEYPPDATSSWAGYLPPSSFPTVDNYPPDWISDPSGAAYKGLNTRHEEGVYDVAPAMAMSSSSSSSSFGAGRKSKDANSGYDDSMDGVWDALSN